MAQKAQKLFSITNPAGKYNPRHVAQGLLNATGYFSDTVTDVLVDLSSEVWVDDIVWLGEELIFTLDAILGRLDISLFAVAQKSNIFATFIK